MQIDKCFDRPDGLSNKGNAIYDKIMQFFQEHDLLHSGGCKVFYSPTEWKERGEEYGINSELIVVHDGGNHARAFSWIYEDYKCMEELQKVLNPLEVFAEQCTGWYSAIYCI
jgi:hypothetical protein